MKASSIVDEEPVSIVAVRADGRRSLFSRAKSKEAADATIKALAKIGLRAELVTGLDPRTRPGTAIRPPAATKRARRVA